ncbi:hypothetical protein [uncultured Kocuria sp.]|uniref:hypothetical protein n=1 Tax=uncultured Kocuria sp. TaxID=259305 RepID=UPI00262AC072|nr:hypothetical protein [uncultured Kocuria sp.]
MTRPAHARSNGPTGESEAPLDDVLLDAAHSGDTEAFGMLRERYHGTALAVARSRTGSAEESERLAGAAFGRIEQIVGEGGGPRAFLGAFVVWMVGREADGGTRPVALPDDPSDPTSLVRVFSGLPAEWQGVLWRTEVLGHSARRAAAALGLGAVAAAGLHRDMVRGLRGLYGQAAADRTAGPECAEFSGELAHFVRGTRGQRSRRDVKTHLDGCARCTAEYLSRQDIGTGLRTWTLPVLAGLPLWGTEALELAGLIAGAGTATAAGAGTGAAAAGAGVAAVGAGTGAAGARAGTAGARAGAGGVGAGAAAAGAGAAGARPDEAASTSAWSGRTAKVLLGAGALATAVAVAAVGVSGGGDPVPAADSLAAEQAPRTAQDLERSSADDSGAARTDGDEAGGGDAGPDGEQDSARPEEAGPGDAPAGAPGDGAPQEVAALVAVADRGSVGTGAAAAEDGGASADTSGPSAVDGATRPGAVAEGPAPERGGAPAAEAGTPGAASAGGSARDTSSQGSPTSAPSTRQPEAPSTAPAPARKAGPPAPVPPVPTSLPTVDASPAPLKAPAPPARTTAPPTDPARTGTAPGAGREHPHAGARGARQDERRSWHREQSRHEDRSGARRDAGRRGGDHERGRHGTSPGHGDGGAGEERARR